jgi:hypothetical protein
VATIAALAALATIVTDQTAERITDNDQIVIVAAQLEAIDSRVAVCRDAGLDVEVADVGRLFKRSNRSSRRTELLIFITPKILDELPR